MEQLLGEESEPDSAFFVESWTVGVAAATENLLQRRQEQKSRTPWSSDFFSSNGFVPCVLIEDCAGEEEAPDAMKPLHRAMTASYVDRWPSVAVDPRPTEPQPEMECAEVSGAGISLPLTVQEARRLLGLVAGCTREQIKIAYRRMASRYHPDRLGQKTEQERHIATERMISINEAYRLLCGPHLREM